MKIISLGSLHFSFLVVSSLKVVVLFTFFQLKSGFPLVGRDKHRYSFLLSFLNYGGLGDKTSVQRDQPQSEIMEIRLNMI